MLVESSAIDGDAHSGTPSAIHCARLRMQIDAASLLPLRIIMRDFLFPSFFVFVVFFGLIINNNTPEVF